MKTDKDISFVPGQIYRRRDLHERFGGQRQGGISTPKSSPFIFLITGDSGKQYGYADEWTRKHPPQRLVVGDFKQVSPPPSNSSWWGADGIGFSQLHVDGSADVAIAQLTGPIVNCV